MQKKYWYEEGMCTSLGYKGQYPVTYTSNDDFLYKRNAMGCSMLQDGRCSSYEKCEVFLSAPEQMEKTWQLRDKKMS